MIRLIDIRLNAAHPELPLAEAVTYTGAPSTMLIRGVPGNCGKWCITSVYAAATFPDGSTSTRLAVQSANGVWVATLPAANTSGRTANGVRIMADGEDENGELVTGYVLGVADFAVASLGVTPAPEPGATSYQMLYFDTVPGVLRKGDVTKIEGVLKLYNGTAWEPFAAPVTFDDAVTRTSANGVKSSGIWSAIWGALAALPTGFASLYDWCVAQLAKKLGNTGDQMLNGGSISIDNNGPDTMLHLTGIQGDVQIENWGGEYRAVASQQNPDALWRWPGVASPDALARLFDVMRFSSKRGYQNGEIVFYNGGLYRCVITLHSGAWNDSSFELVLGGLSTGTPTAPTPTAGDSSTKVATTAFVQGAVGSIETFQHDAGGYFIEVEAS